MISIFVRGTDSHLWHRAFFDEPWEDLGRPPGIPGTTPTPPEHFKPLGAITMVSNYEYPHVFVAVEAYRLLDTAVEEERFFMGGPQS